MTDLDSVIARMSEAQREIILRASDELKRAGELSPSYSHSLAQGWLRETPCLSRHFRHGYLAYRLTPLGIAVKARLQEQANGG